MEDTKKIKARANILLQQKISKQKAYTQLLDEFPDSEKVAEALRFIPDHVREKKYNWMNYVIILLALTSITLQLKSPTWEIIWPLISIAMVLAKKYQFFFLFILSGSLSLFSSIIALSVVFSTNLVSKINADYGIILYPTYWLFSGIIYVLYGLYIPKLISPLYETYQDEKLDENGNLSSVWRHRFR